MLCWMFFVLLLSLLFRDGVVNYAVSDRSGSLCLEAPHGADPERSKLISEVVRLHHGKLFCRQSFSAEINKQINASRGSRRTFH